MSFIIGVRLKDLSPGLEYAAEIPAVKSLADMEELSLDNSVTYFVGENCSGISTLLEAISVKYGFRSGTCFQGKIRMRNHWICFAAAKALQTLWRNSGGITPGSAISRSSLR